VSRARLIVPALVAAALAPAAAQATGADTLTQNARLQGTFIVKGTVRSAVNVPGERRGEKLTRRWSFTPKCPVGACGTVQLARQRGAKSTDTLLLHRRRPGYYTGTGSFTVPVRCNGRIDRHGERARFTITVTITSATAAAAGAPATATGFTATYRNPSRTGLTKCYSAPAYDSARYTGTPAQPPPSSG
jgi:hypothetical protein